MPSKVPYIESLLKEKNQLFICLTETWLKGHTQAELKIDGYRLFRSDRKGRKHTRGRYSGGAAIYLRSDIAATSEEVLKFSNGTVEAIAVYSQRENLFIASLYRQPDNPTHRSTAYELSQALSKIESAIESIQGTPTVMIGCREYLKDLLWFRSSFENRNPEPFAKKNTFFIIKFRIYCHFWTSKLQWAPINHI